MTMTNREYNKHKKAMLDRAMMISIEGLQSAIIDEVKTPALPYLIFDTMMTALEKKMGKKAFKEWSNTL